jgi:hypothetical protein
MKPRKPKTKKVKRGYPPKPRHLNELSWFYELRHGLDVLIQPNSTTDAVRTRIPWRRLEAAVDNHRAIKRQKKKPLYPAPLDPVDGLG